MRAVLLATSMLFAVPSLASAERDDVLADCKAELDRRVVTFKSAKRAVIARAGEITVPLCGIPWTYEQPMVVDCSLAVSLVEVVLYMRAIGFELVGIST